jgi:hypothetical protein
VVKTLQSGNAAAIIKSNVLVRDFLEIKVRDRTTDAIVIERLWSGDMDVSAAIVDPDAGTTPTLTWQGSGGLIAIDVIPRVASLIVQEINIVMESFGVDVDRIFRLYDPQRAEVRIWRGYLDETTRLMSAPGEPRFFGFIDEIQWPRAAEGSEASLTVVCKSHSIEGTRFNPVTRSHESQLMRNATDNFYQDVATIKDREFFWGKAREKAS